MSERWMSKGVRSSPAETNYRPGTEAGTRVCGPAPQNTATSNRTSHGEGTRACARASAATSGSSIVSLRGTISRDSHPDRGGMARWGGEETGVGSGRAPRRSLTSDGKSVLWRLRCFRELPAHPSDVGGTPQGPGPEGRVGASGNRNRWGVSLHPGPPPSGSI